MLTFRPAGDSLKSTTVEGSILELASRLQIAETVTNDNGTLPPNRINLQFTADGASVTIAANNLPIQINDLTGSPALDIPNLINIPNWAESVRNGNPLNTLLNYLIILSEAENLVPNTQRRTRISADLARARISMGITLDTINTIAPDGGTVIIAKPYAPEVLEVNNVNNAQ
jgi:hypothetical protein